MSTKKLYIAISDSGDGSQALFYTFDGELIGRMSDADYDQIGENWMSGDGFQYESINVLESATMADLGIDERWRVLKRENYSQLFEEDELEEEE
ncbi:hypothetical protein ISREJYDI_CDS0063 [Pseudomonas phage UNO-G1W1]|jgi:hypothetical protein|uniref:Phage protein n=1 Tax=Pseudomonas phage UNO-G1W1 TaxID=3136609 RepID=A0AAX4MWB9_9CAUD